MPSKQSLGEFSAPNLGAPKSMGISEIMPFVQQLAMMKALQNRGQVGQQQAANEQPPNSNLTQEAYDSPYGNKYGNPQFPAQQAQAKAQATQQAAPNGIPTKSTNALGIQSIMPDSALAQGGAKATENQAVNMTNQGSLAERAIAELKNAVGSYKNVLAERKSTGSDPYGNAISMGQDYLSSGQHPWQRKMASDVVPTSTIPGYQTSKDAFGGAMAAMFVQGQRNPAYAQKLGSELTPSLTSTGSEEDTNLIRQSALTPIATEWALQHGLTTANDLAHVTDFKQLQPLVKKAMDNGWNPSSPDVQNKVNEVLKTPPTDPRYSDVKIEGLDYPKGTKEKMISYIQQYPDKKPALLQRYKELTGEEYNG